MNLREVFSELAAAREDGFLDRYAIGGAVAAAVYIEAAETEDVDVFILATPAPGSLLISLDPVCRYFKERGAEVDGEPLRIGGWLVQLLPVPTLLEEDALLSAVEIDVEGTLVPVFSAEHLAAIALHVGRLKDKVRLKSLIESPTLDRPKFDTLVERFTLGEKWRQAQILFEEHP